MDARAQDRRDDVDLGAVRRALVELGAQLGAVERAVRDDEDTRRRRPPAGRRGRRLPERATASGSLVETSHTNAPATAPTSSARPTSGSRSAPSATAAAITAALPMAMWNASASLRTGFRISA